MGSRGAVPVRARRYRHTPGRIKVSSRPRTRKRGWRVFTNRTRQKIPAAQEITAAAIAMITGSKSGADDIKELLGEISCVTDVP
jgi:hypothetical protein